LSQSSFPFSRALQNIAPTTFVSIQFVSEKIDGQSSKLFPDASRCRRLRGRGGRQLFLGVFSRRRARWALHLLSSSSSRARAQNLSGFFLSGSKTTDFFFEILREFFWRDEFVLIN